MRRLQHIFNALHVYCLLCKLRVPKRLALKIARIYELFTKRLIYPELKIPFG